MKDKAIERANFADVCNYISRNYSELKKEFKEINEMLNVAESFSLAYLDRRFMKAHFKAVVKKHKMHTIELLLSKLEKVKKTAAEEFFQEVDVVNLYDKIIMEMRAGDIVPFVWRTKEKIKYVTYSVERIVNAEGIDKKIAILKGMIAYY